MSMSDYVTVEVENNHLTRLLLRNGWQEAGDVAALSQAITDAISAALPQPQEEAPRPTHRRKLTVYELQQYMEMHNEWRRRARDLRRRIEAGEFRMQMRDELVDARERVFVEFREGRFDALHLHPTWAIEASLQALSDEVLNLLGDVSLIRHDPAEAERQQLRDLDRRIREFAS